MVCSIRNYTAVVHKQIIGTIDLTDYWIITYYNMTFDVIGASL